MNYETFLFSFCLIISLCFTGIEAKKFEGTLDSSSDWAFIARFCFLSSNGDMKYVISYPLNFYPDGTEIGYDLLLYYDDKWAEVYQGSEYKNCSRKHAVLRRELNQIITLTSRDPGSGCKLLVQTGNGTYVKEVMPWEQLVPDASVQRSWICEGTRTFSTIRDRWWYFAIASCANPAGLSNVQYAFSFHNDPYDPMKREFSADEFGILETSIVFVVLVTILLFCSIWVGSELAELNFLHVTFKLYFWAVFTFFLSIIFLLAGYAHLGATGYEVRGLMNTSYVFNAISTIIFILLLLLLGKGYTITHGRLAGVVQVVVATIVILLTFLYAVLFFYQIAIFDPASVLYLYQSPGGYGICAVRIGVWIYFAYACFRTIYHHKSKSEFYYTFFCVYTVWFFAFPIFVFLGSAVLDKWVRLKIVTIIEMSITVVAYSVILALMWPTHTNKFFPFHVRVAQIGTIDDPDEQSDEEQGAIHGASVTMANPAVAGPRMAAIGYRAPSDWNIFTGTGGYAEPTTTIGMTETSGQLPPIRSTNYNLFVAGGQQNNEATPKLPSSQPQAASIGSPRFSEVYGSDQ